MMSTQDQQSKLFYELCSLVLAFLKLPQLPPTSSSPMLCNTSSSSSSRRAGPMLTKVSPAGFASLLLGISMALMLCGSVTFMIGFILMPWVLGLVMFLYFVGIISNLSSLGRAILYPTMASSCSPSSSSSSSRRIAVATSTKEISDSRYKFESAMVEFLCYKGPTSRNKLNVNDN